ncbi:MAG: TatD family hydrolase [Deltaproteobacteria bacterium]|nr:TatD family hydrolase [Deltaproteobacteria bacterium]
MIEIIDSHTHIDTAPFDPDREEVIERALAAGVTTMINIGASEGFLSNDRSIALAEKYDCIYATAGIHPHDAEVEIDRGRLVELAKHPKVVAIGETGLDFFRDWSPQDLQYKWFRLQIEIAHEVKKPLIIHSRSAGEQCYEILKEMEAEKVGGVFHCFAEDAQFAKKLAQINFLVSFPGPVTFKKSEDVRTVVKEVPLEQIMVETDAPYLAPEPFRGRRCEPAHTIHTAKKIAEVKEIPFEQCARILSQTTRDFFKI